MRQKLIMASCIGILIAIVAYRLFAASLIVKGICITFIVILLATIRFIAKNDDTDTTDTSAMDDSIRNDVRIDAHQKSSGEEKQMVSETAREDQQRGL